MHAMKGRAFARAPSSVYDTLRSNAARSLDAPVRASMESCFKHDFSGVRVHTGAAAARSASDVGARAYTVGDDIVFGGANYAPFTARGQALLAHELGHVVQQRGARASYDLRISDGHDARGATRTESLPEQALQRQPDTDPHVGPGLPSMPSQLGGLTIRLQLDANMAPTGKASVSVSGPASIPLVGGAEIGLQRNADGTYTAVTGKGSTIVSAADVQKILQGSTNVDPKKPKEIRLPGCSDLRRPGQGAFYSVAEFKQHAMFTPGITGVYWKTLPDWLIQALIDACKPVPLPVPDRAPRPDYNDAPAPAGDTRMA